MRRPRWLAIVNPSAGAGRARAHGPALIRALQARGIRCDCVETQRPGDATALTRAAAHTVDGIVAVGGDGTVHEIVNGLPLNAAPLLAVAPFGTGNDWARGLGVPRTPVGIAELIARATTQSRPIGVVTYTGCSGRETRRFVNGAGIGLDVAVLQQLPTRGPRALAYLIGTLRALRQFVPVELEGDAPQDGRPRRALLRYAGLGPYAGGGMRLTPHADGRSPTLHLTEIPDLPLWRLLGLLPALYGGTLDRAEAVYSGVAEHVIWRTPATVQLEADGQLLGPGPYELSVLAERLNVIAPQGEPSDNGASRSNAGPP